MHKSKLGQNFLHDEHTLQRIAEAADINIGDIVLEIGTGPGNLTKYLCERAKFVYTIEKDARLCRIAEENLKNYKNVEIICGDILKLRITNYELRIVGNPPYYITTPIIFKLLDQRRHIRDIVIMVQKEVAQRIVASPGTKDYGILSCSAQFYTKPKILFYIKKGAFRPQPDVDSALVRMEILKRPSVLVKDEEGFFKIIKAAFNQRRKMLRSSLSAAIGSDKAETALRMAGIDPARRPETLSLEEFAKITDHFNLRG